jgi:hypothetical protein
VLRRRLHAPKTSLSKTSAAQHYSPLDANHLTQ